MRYENIPNKKLIKGYIGKPLTSIPDPYETHKSSPNDGINLYSFSLYPFEHQPSGTCNYSRIENSVLNLTFKNTGCPISYDFFIFAINYTNYKK